MTLRMSPWEVRRDAGGFTTTYRTVITVGQLECEYSFRLDHLGPVKHLAAQFEEFFRELNVMHQRIVSNPELSRDAKLAFIREYVMESASTAPDGVNAVQAVKSAAAAWDAITKEVTP